MNCKNCGTPLMGIEHACPVCGAPLPTNPPTQPVQGGVPVAAPGVPVAPMPEQLASQPPQMMPGGSAPAGLPTEPENPQPEPKKGNNIFAILLLVVAFAAIGVGVFLAMTDSKEEAKPADNTPVDETPAPTPDDESGAISYAGYSFNIPSDYASAEVGEHGLMLRKEGYIYTVQIDYTKGYDYYKQEFQKQQTAPTEVVTIGDKEYVICTLTDSTGAKAIEYMTKATETATFVGLVVKSDYSAGTQDDLTDINNLLTSATQQTEITPGADEDAGKTEIVNYIPKFSKEIFN